MSIVTNLYKLIDNGKNGRNIGISTGFTRLDKITYGIQRGFITVIAGDTGSGKSTYTLYTHVFKPLCNNSKVNILYFSFEMSAEVILAKLLTMFIKEQYNVSISYETVLSLNDIVSDEELNLIYLAKEWLNSIEDKITILDKAVTADAMYGIIKEWNRKFGSFVKVDEHREEYIENDKSIYKIIVIDHIKLLEYKVSVKAEIDKACDYLMWFRNKCNDTIAIVQQLNRNFKSMDRRQGGTYQLLQLDDLSDSSGPAHAAEIVIGIFDAYREKMKDCEGYKVAHLLDNFRYIQVLKHRFGKSNKNIGLLFNGESGSWTELPKAEDITDYSIFLDKTNTTKDNCNKQDNELNEFKITL